MGWGTWLGRMASQVFLNKAHFNPFSAELQFLQNRYFLTTEHFILHYPRYVKKLSFWKNCDSAEKGLKRALLKKTLMASYLAKCPNPCTNCLGWMPFSTSQ